jgi:peptidyl-prolyl cis-trans isomerase C
MVPPFAEAVKAMNKGDISVAPVQTNFGFHVIRVDDTREIEKPSFEEMRTQVQQQMIRATINDYINGLRESAEIEIK